VYAVYDAAGALQYVGMSRKACGTCAERASPAPRFLAEASPDAQMNASIMIHMQDMPAEKCASVKLHVVEVRSCVRRLHEALALTTSGAVSCASQAQTRDALQGAWKQWVEEHGACGACLGCAVCRDAQTSLSRSRVHGAAVAASGSIPAGNTPEVKDWTTRKTRQSKCVLHTALCVLDAAIDAAPTHARLMCAPRPSERRSSSHPARAWRT